jgi:hypothetical protein
LSAMRTRKLASDRQKEKNFMRAPASLRPLPLWERVDAMRSIADG